MKWGNSINQEISSQQKSNIFDFQWGWKITTFAVASWQEKFWVPFQYKDHLSRYGDFHYEDNTVVKPSYLYNEILALLKEHLYIEMAFWAPSQYKDHFYQAWGFSCKDRPSFNMGIHILVRHHLYIETVPCMVAVVNTRIFFMSLYLDIWQESKLSRQKFWNFIRKCIWYLTIIIVKHVLQTLWYYKCFCLNNLSLPERSTWCLNHWCNMHISAYSNKRELNGIIPQWTMLT